MSKEIELKFKISEEVYKQIIADLKNSAKKIGESKLIDTYYIPDYKEFEVNGVTQECVRIRQTEKENVLCYKKIHYEANPIYCDEYETKISDKENMQNILFALNFSTQMVIDKTRYSYSLDNFEIDIDYVKNLGYLLEVELKDNNASLEKIYKFVEKYGLSKKDVTYEGIQVLMKKAMLSNK